MKNTLVLFKREMRLHLLIIYTKCLAVWIYTYALDNYQLITLQAGSNNQLQIQILRKNNTFNNGEAT